MSQMKFSDIQVGDLLYDEVRKIFGVVSNELEAEADTWIAHWSDGRTVWVFKDSIISWKKQLEILKGEHNVR